MIRPLFLNLMIIMSVTACTRAKDISMMPRPEVNNMCNFVVSIKKCDHFLENLDDVKLVFLMACTSAHFENPDIVVESVDKDVFLYGVHAQKGYAGLYVDMKDKCCILEFYSEDNSYDYAEFLAAFMIPFNIISNQELFDDIFVEIY